MTANRAEVRAALAELEPPLYLRSIPGDVLHSDVLAGWLDDRGMRRPTLLELAAERSRRRRLRSVSRAERHRR